MSVRVLFLLNHPLNDGSARYRVYQYLPYLQREGYECTVRPFSTPALFQAIRSHGQQFRKVTLTAFCAARRMKDLLSVSNYDLVVIHREAFPFLMPFVEEKVLDRNPNVIFSFDDAIYSGHDDGSRLNHPWLYRFKYGNGVDKVLERSKAVIAGNSTLAAYAARFNRNVHVVPTVIDLAQYTLPSVRSLPAKRIRIGWFGSNTTSPYLQIALPALQRLEQNYPDQVEFRFYGDTTLSLGLSNASYFPFSLKTEIDDLRTIDIGIMPMPDNDWTRGKCSFKAIQYMALGAPTIASPVGMALDVVQHGKNGFLANTPDEWYSAFESLITDPALWKRISCGARRSVEENFTTQIWGSRLRRILDEVVGVTRNLEFAGAVHS
jgi:glycosyltransferase involved in cell wall biosynthesis